jgi:hypothetical protein
MSPEQTISSSNVDAQSDIFSAGLVLYEFISGWLPFDVPDADVVGYMSAIRSVPHRPLSEAMPNVDPSLANIIDRSLAKDKASRYRTCEEMATDLTQFLSVLADLEKGLAAELSRAGLLSETIAADSIGIGPPSESVQFRPLDVATDYGLNLQRYSDRRPTTVPPGAVADHGKRSLIGGVLVLILIAVGVGGYYLQTTESALGTLQLDVAPWAEVESIREVPGDKEFLSEKRYTPFSMDLPPGTYRVRVVHPQFGDLEFPLEIVAGKPSRVLRSFPGFAPGAQ